MAANIPGFEEVEEPDLPSDGKEGSRHELTIDSPGIHSAV